MDTCPDLWFGSIRRHLHFRSVIQHPLQGKIFINDILLWHKSDHVLQRIKVAAQIDAIAVHPSGNVGIKSAHCVHDCRLSCTGTSDDSDKFIVADLTGDIV